MDKKKITLLLVSNRKGTTKKFVASLSWIRAVTFFGLLAMVVTAAMVVDYVGLLAQSIENKQLRAENNLLHEKFRVVEGKLNALEKALERTKVNTAKLKLITNADDPNRTLNLAMGPGVKTKEDLEQFNVNIDERAPAAELKSQDKIFFKNAPVNSTKGELSVAGQRDYASLAIRIDLAVRETQLREQDVLRLWQKLEQKESRINATPNIKPVRGWYTSKFGYRISPFSNRPVMHNGLDIAASPGTPVYAPADGVVSFAGYDPGYGRLVSIDHGFGLVTRYGHNSQIFVKVGQKVSRWDIIAAVGNTGRSTGPHLHYEVRVENVPVDPMNYIIEF